MRATFASRYYNLQSLEEVHDRALILDAVRESFIAHEAGRVIQAAPVHLRFEKGDCHIKSGYLRGGDTFTIKVATGFYANDRLGLPNANGHVILCSQQTGQPLAFFDDHGMLTAWRTVAATVIAASARCRVGPLRIAIVGTGLQAGLAADWLPLFCDVASQRIWGRDSAKAAGLAARTHFATTSEPNLETLCRSANLIVTATAASSPLVMADWVEPGTHIVALGADNPGKIEIDPALFARCETIVTDDHAQCVDHGDFGAAIRAGMVTADQYIGLGNVETRGGAPVSPEGISIVDLTGLAAQDDAVARLFFARLTSSR